MTEMIGRYGPIATEAESYRDGLESGRIWHWDHVPGGPFIFRANVSARYFSDPDWIAYCARSADNNREWLRGWHKGRKEGTP